jgi:transcriptional regulator with XRE-family HTH domain
VTIDGSTNRIFAPCLLANGHEKLAFINRIVPYGLQPMAISCPAVSTSGNSQPLCTNRNAHEKLPVVGGISGVGDNQMASGFLPSNASGPTSLGFLSNSKPLSAEHDQVSPSSPSENGQGVTSHYFDPRHFDSHGVAISNGHAGSHSSHLTDNEQPATSDRVLNRVAEVREQQGVSQRTMARRLGIDLKSYRCMEEPRSDLTLSDLRRIQKALDVPLVDLLEDDQSLSRPVAERAKLLRIMKTAVAMRDKKSPPSIQRMSQMLTEQLIDLMPELAHVSGWPQYGVRRGIETLGRMLENRIDMSQVEHDD